MKLTYVNGPWYIHLDAKNPGKSIFRHGICCFSHWVVLLVSSVSVSGASSLICLADGQRFVQVCVGAGQAKSRAWAWYHDRHFAVEVWDFEVLHHDHRRARSSWFHQEHDHWHFAGRNSCHFPSCKLVIPLKWICVVVRSCQLSDREGSLSQTLGWCQAHRKKAFGLSR